MKTFKDLKFEPHMAGNGLMARLLFDNGYGVSVIRFKLSDGQYGSYTDTEKQWEVAVLKHSDGEWELTYQTPITNDVIGRCTAPDVTKIMKRVQEL
jgi:hypothetical protein